MKFGPVPLTEAIGGILAHSILLGSGKRIRKGTVLDAEAIGLIEAEGMTRVSVAMSEPGDVLEDEAATEIAIKLTGGHYKLDAATTGRVNIFSAVNGVFRVSKEIVDAINRIDPGITIATLPDYESVNEGRMIATIKIIPYGISRAALDAVLALELTDIFDVSEYSAKRVGMISTVLPTLKESVIDKTRKVLEGRLEASGSELVGDLRVPHEVPVVEHAIHTAIADADMIILFGASAISDVRDVIPAAIESAGGSIKRFGMPVDPGNLMLLAELDGKPVIGAPGCARSPAENGFDWVLQRLLAGIDVGADDIMGMGVGGLLMEIGARPHPREKKVSGRAHIAAIILAAGQSRRMGALNKMTVDVHGKSMVRHVADAVAVSKVNNAVVVTGSNPDEIEAVLKGVDCDFAHNADFEEGLSTSLRTGIQSLGEDVGRAIILLGDMPFVESAMIDNLIAASDENPGKIIIATHEGKRGNPVLWPRRFFEELTHIQGDTGARHIIETHRDLVIEVELGEAASVDIDTKEVLDSL